MLPARCLSITDRDFLESMVSMDEIKASILDCGSKKASGPDGYSFMFTKKFWDLLKHDIQSLVVCFFSTSTFPQVGLASVMTSILINGSPTSEFSLKRGLRQRDHVSPFLFIIVMEGLHMALNDGLAANMFHGVKVGSP
ncbi:hypothetical protein Tco_1433957, partial [Tanacetum coccineum]